MTLGTAARSKITSRARLTVVVVLSAMLFLCPLAARAGGAAALSLDGKGDVTGRGLNDTWYLAEGSTAWGFRTWFQIENPGSRDLNARVTFMLNDGSTRQIPARLPAASTVWVDPRTLIGERDFSTRVECVEGGLIAVSRVMISGEQQEAVIHSSIGATAPSKEWYLAEGSTGGEFDTFVLVQNPNETATSVTIMLLTPQYNYPAFIEDLPAHSRKTYRISDVLKNEYSVSTWVIAQQPVIAERAMYWGPNGTRIGGHESIGVTNADNSWYLAEGCTGGDFETWVLLMNPNETAAYVFLEFYTEKGKIKGPELYMPKYSRRTIDVSKFVPATWSVATGVDSDSNIVVERAMYGNNRQWGHDTVGMTSPHADLYLPFAQCGPDTSTPGYYWETWTLVQNPNNYPVAIRIYYLAQPGATENAYVDDTLPANTRRTYDMARALPSGSWAAGIRVSSRTAGAKVMAESSTYGGDSAARYAGCCSIGGFSD